MSTPSTIQWPGTDRRNIYDVELVELLEDFERSAPNLFETDEDVNVTVQEYRDNGMLELPLEVDNADSGAVPPTTYRLRSTLEVNNFVQVAVSGCIPVADSRLRSIPKPFSESELEVSKTGVQSLFSHFKISPGFWSVLKLFGARDLENKCNHESSGGFNDEAWEPSSKSYGFSYTVKHVEHHGRQDTYDPWSIRQIGVHHEYDDETQENTFVILNPSKALTRRLQHVTSTTEPIEIHRLILSSVTERWNDYLAYLEFCFDDISKKGLLSNPTRTASAVEVRFSDSQRIQKLQDTILRVSQMLTLNLSVFNHLLSSPSLFAQTPSAPDSPPNRAHFSAISTLGSQTHVRQSRASNLLHRLDGTSLLVRSILDAQSLSTLQTSSRTTAELAALAREDSRKATKDARTLSTITILGFVYLPASFVATLLGTQYIHVDADPVRLWLNDEMWVFLILTVILLIVSVGGWGIWEWKMRGRDRAERGAGVDNEKGI